MLPLHVVRVLSTMENKLNPEGSLSLSALLSAVPVRNESVRWEKESIKTIRVYVPLRTKWFMGPPFSWLFKFSRERAVELDVLGTEVWNMCDGKTSVEIIVEAFAKAHKLTFHESRLSIMEFLRLITRRGLIVLVGTNPQEALH